MVHIKIKKGLNIPLTYAPKGSVQNLFQKPRRIFFDFSSFPSTIFNLTKEEGETISIGEPLAHDKKNPKITFVSPGGGTIVKYLRGEKRRLLGCEIELFSEEKSFLHTPIDIINAPQEELFERILIGGALPHIKMRPFGQIASSKKMPRTIFIKALNSAPLSLPQEHILERWKDFFIAGVLGLSKIAKEDVHIVEGGSSIVPKEVTLNKNVFIHTAEGPHPVANHSVHIEHISPIQSIDDCIWTLDCMDVVILGALWKKGIYLTERIYSVGGDLPPEKAEFILSREGVSIEDLIRDRNVNFSSHAFISGDCLSGKEVKISEWIRFGNNQLTVLKKSREREFLHFLRLGKNKFTASNTYFSSSEKAPEFNTKMHGEHRFFVIGSPYDKVMPLDVPTMLLVKAVMAENFDLAESLGFLETVPEDFALPAFVCPCKIEMVDIMENGIFSYLKELGE